MTLEISGHRNQDTSPFGPTEKTKNRVKRYRTYMQATAISLTVWSRERGKEWG